MQCLGSLKATFFAQSSAPKIPLRLSRAFLVIGLANQNGLSSNAHALSVV